MEQIGFDHVVLDVETANPIGEAGLSWEDTDKLGVSCAVVYEFASDRFRVYGPPDVLDLRARILVAHRVTTFNGWKFDLPVIWGLPRRGRVLDLARTSDDILGRIWQALGLDPDDFGDAHKGWSLNNVAKGTLGWAKIGYSGNAPLWFREGLWARVANYCLDDVALTRDLCRHIDAAGWVRRIKAPSFSVHVPPWSPPAEEWMKDAVRVATERAPHLDWEAATRRLLAKIGGGELIAGSRLGQLYARLKTGEGTRALYDEIMSL